MINEPQENKLPEELLATLTVRQQRLEFGEPDQWQQLPLRDRLACCDSIVAMLCHVMATEEIHQKSFNQDADRNER